MWYVFDALEIVSEGFETYDDAATELKWWIEEIYFLDYYPNPRIEYLQEDEVDGGAVRESKLKERKVWK